MREQGAGLGMTVSRRFDSKQQAEHAVQQLRQAGFREEDIRVWQHKRLATPFEDRLARTVEGILAGAVIFGLAGFFLTAAYTWAVSETIDEQLIIAVTAAAAAIGAVVIAIAVNIVSTRVSFSPGVGHAAPAEPPSVVTVRTSGKEADAKRVLETASGAGH
jgi:hypothetical protein